MSGTWRCRGSWSVLGVPVVRLWRREPDVPQVIVVFVRDGRCSIETPGVIPAAGQLALPAARHDPPGGRSSGNDLDDQRR